MPPSTPNAKRRAFGLWITTVAALAYCLWLGVHWLPLGMSEHELSASASRVWDVKQQVAEHHFLPWWTPYFMSGSSYGFNHSRGFYMLPWIFFSMFTDLLTAGKLVALMAMFASAVTMYFCARHFLKSEWAATLAALVFLLHPEQIIRAAGAEHITIILFFPFMPLLWLTLARALERNRFRDTFVCAVVAVLAWWTDNKQAFIMFLFLFVYAVYWLWPRRKQWQATARTCGWLAALGLVLGTWVLVPGFAESRYVKLFYGDPLQAWQRGFAFKSLLGLVDRDGSATRNLTNAVMQQIQANGGRVGSQQELEQVQRLMSLGTDSPEKYMGVTLLAILVATVLWNRRRVERRAFWFFVCSLLVTVMLATGFDSVWTANWATWQALSSQHVSGIALAWLLVSVAFLVLFCRRKLTTPQKWTVAGVALVMFLFVPGFGWLAALPYFSDIRAPYVFYDLPAVFFGAILAGFLVTDVLDADKWRAHVPKIVAALGVLLLLDYWPYQKPTWDSGVPAHTVSNLRATYRSLKGDMDWVKTYSVSGRYFHLLGPMWGGKPQVYEAFYNWMCPLGTGLLNQQAFTSWENHRAFLNLMAARYVVFDKTDSGNARQDMQQVLGLYRNSFPVVTENEDFVVFRNEMVHPYVTGYGRSCLYAGDIHQSAALALALSAKNWPLVQAKEATPGEVPVDEQRQYEQVYGQDSPPFPPITAATPVTLEHVQLTRENAENVRIQLTAPSACLAVIAESYYPFWHAEIDGQAAEVLRVSCGLMGVQLPAGAHTIQLRYEAPRAYAFAAVISIGGLLIGLGFAVRDRSRARR
ncbi:MAG TPA: 6-pyruvoyl-tetrahydropterin synthase-related protein [Verrucomicrobiae bacterium]|nr:6-pyruvoyl-tetrahydropterin synthase-related protein [Verrucomicrobiae bacterium]